MTLRRLEPLEATRNEISTIYSSYLKLRDKLSHDIAPVEVTLIPDSFDSLDAYGIGEAALPSRNNSRKQSQSVLKPASTIRSRSNSSSNFETPHKVSQAPTTS